MTMHGNEPKERQLFLAERFSIKIFIKLKAISVGGGLGPQSPGLLSS